MNAVYIVHDHKVKLDVEEEERHLPFPLVESLKGQHFIHRGLTLRGPSRVTLLLPFGYLRIDGRKKKAVSETGNNLQVVSPGEEDQGDEVEEEQEDEEEQKEQEDEEEEMNS